MTRGAEFARLPVRVMKPNASRADGKSTLPHAPPRAPSMPAPSTLPKDALTVRFPPEDVDESYQLLELPPEILKAVEGGESVG